MRCYCVLDCGKMMISFYKMTGAGNDFVMLDNRDLSLTPILTREIIASLCHRRFGIGADGLIAVEPAEGDAHVRMRYYNADGGEAEMCGNGARCFTAFVDFLTDGEQEMWEFETMAGIVKGKVNEDDTVTIELTKPHGLCLHTMAASEGLAADVHFLNTGVPHAVAFVKDLEELDVKTTGAFLRYHDHFAPAGTNANFAEVLEPQMLKIRTYERGVEDETLACGTGMTATALVHALLTDAVSPISLQVAGGDVLSIGFKRKGESFSDVTLTGPALIVFRGEVILSV